MHAYQWGQSVQPPARFVRQRLIRLSRKLEACMRVESPVVSQSLIESSKSIEKKELNVNTPRGSEASEEALSYLPSPLGFSKTYSVASLKKASEYHAKFMTVAENNVLAAKNLSGIPSAILSHFNR